MYVIIFALLILQFKLGFFTINTIGILAGQVLVVGTCSVHCRIFNNISGHYLTPSCEN